MSTIPSTAHEALFVKSTFDTSNRLIVRGWVYFYFWCGRNCSDWVANCMLNNCIQGRLLEWSKSRLNHVIHDDYWIPSDECQLGYRRNKSHGIFDSRIFRYFILFINKLYVLYLCWFMYQLTWRLSDRPITANERDELLDMKVRMQTKCTIFLSYTSNMISSGIRETIRFLVQHKMVIMYFLYF